MQQEDYLDTITLMAYRMLCENPSMSDSEAIRKAIENYWSNLLSFAKKIVAIQKELGEENWQIFKSIFENKKTLEQIEADYNEMLASDKLIDGITTTEVELSIEYEGTVMQKTFPPGTHIKISKDIWETPGEYIEVWTTPRCVDYTTRQNVLAF